MKSDKKPDPAGKNELQLIPVRFEFYHPTARLVGVAGTFNSWHPTTKAMQYLGNGDWMKEAFLPPGSYEYCFVVDDEWFSDPLAKDSQPNSFGGMNSILNVSQHTAIEPTPLVTSSSQCRVQI